MGVKGLSHVAIQANNYQATIAFYTEVLGFKVGHHWSLPAFMIEDASMLVSPDRRTCIEVFDNNAAIPAQGKKQPLMRRSHTELSSTSPFTWMMSKKSTKKPLLMEQRPLSNPAR